MKNKLLIIFCSLFIIGILGFMVHKSYTKNSSSTNIGLINIQQGIKTTPKAVYLVSKDGGQIFEKDIKQHLEVLVVNTFQDLDKIVNQNKKIHIWIDKNSTKLVDNSWLSKKPQKYNLLVVVGYDNSLYSFREQLDLGIKGPYVDWNTTKVGNGFSVWLLTEETSNSRSALNKGYSVEVNVENIFKIVDSYPKAISH